MSKYTTASADVVGLREGEPGIGTVGTADVSIVNCRTAPPSLCAEVNIDK